MSVPPGAQWERHPLESGSLRVRRASGVELAVEQIRKRSDASQRHRSDGVGPERKGPLPCTLVHPDEDETQGDPEIKEGEPGRLIGSHRLKHAEVSERSDRRDLKGNEDDENKREKSNAHAVDPPVGASGCKVERRPSQS